MGALPGSPAAREPVERLVDHAVAEARAYRDAGFTAIAIENMHDRPYVKGGVGPEVTADRRYTNQSIAFRGLAETPEIPLSDVALNSLIDTLEGRFPAQAQIAITQPKTKQVPVTRTKGQTSGSTVKVNLDEIEEAMMREMEKTLPKGNPK